MNEKSDCQHATNRILSPMLHWPTSSSLNVNNIPDTMGKNTLQVDLRHMDGRPGSNAIDVGMDLSEFYKSVEWDILDVPAVRWIWISFLYSYVN